MEKIKNILYPGKAQDDETLYGQGGNTGVLSGEGSHLAGAKDTVGSGNTSGLPGSYPTDSTGTRNTGLASGKTTGNTSGLAGTQNTTGTGAGSSSLGSETTAAGTHSSQFANAVDPRVASDSSETRQAEGTNFTSSTIPQQGTGIGQSQVSSTGVGPNTGYGSTNTAGQHHLGRDTAVLGTTGVAGEELHRRGEYERDNVGSTGTGYNPTSTTQGASHLGRDAAAAGAVGEDSHLHHQHGQDDLRSDANIANQYVKRSSLPSDSNTTNTSSAHHLGRDAAAVGGAGALAEHEHRKHEPTTTGYGDQSGLVGSGLTQDTRRNNVGTEGNLGSNTGYGTTSGTTGVSGPHSTATANRLDPRVNTSGTGGLEDAHHHSKTHGGGAEEADHHHKLGRDAAVGAGGVGAAGLAEHEHRKHENERPTGTGVGSTGVGSTGTEVGSSQQYDNAALPGPAPNTSGPHSKDWMNKLDPRVDASPAAAKVTSGEVPGYGSADKDHHYGRDAAGGVGGAAYEADKHHKHDKDLTAAEREAKKEHKHELKEEKREAKEEKREAKQAQHGDHHYGRDAAGAGIVGGAAYEADKHHQGHRQTDSGIAGVESGNTTTGPHSSNLVNRADPTVDNGRLQEHHYGRDVAGAGVVGGAAYEADKHHRDHQTGSGLTGIAGNTEAAGNTSTAGPHSSNLANRTDPTVDSDRSKDHHYGRDAAGAGVVGGAVYEADKHHKHDKDLSAQEKEDKRIAKLEAKEDKKEAKAEKKEHKGLFSFLHRDKSKKYTPEEEAEFDRQEREHNSHKGRDALAGGAVGAGAYEAEKHHQHGTDTHKPLPTAPGNHGIGTGAGTQNALISGPGEVGFHRAGEGELDTASGTGVGSNTGYGNTSNITGQHHLGRDAAVGAGGVGALAAGEHEHNKHGHSVPLSEKPAGSDLGDKLHGVDRNRGVPGPTGFPGQEGYSSGATGTTGTGTTGQHHYGRDAAAVGGAGALAEHEHRKHEGVGSSQVGNQSSGITGSNTAGQQHHLGRDAAVGAGGAGLAEHEHRKHEDVGSSGLGNQSSGITSGNTTGQQYGNQSSGIIDSNTSEQGQHHLGRDAAAVGGAGALAEHEHRKHEGQGSNFSGTNQQSTLPTRNRSEATTDQSGNPVGSSTTGSQGTQGEQHHLGRDAAAGAGAAGVAEHEHHKHEGSTSNQPTTRSGNEHHTGRDAAAGAGAAGVAEHEHRKHEEGHATGAVTSNEIKGTGPFHYHDRHDPNAAVLKEDQYRKFHGMGTDGTIGEIPPTTGSGATHVAGRGAVEGDDGRNRLHKDPPANHPAAQAQRGEIDGAGSGVGTQSATGSHVPGDKGEREKLANQGEQNIARDTGTANAHGSTNVSTNY